MRAGFSLFFFGLNAINNFVICWLTMLGNLPSGGQGRGRRVLPGVRWPEVMISLRYRFAARIESEDNLIGS